MEASEVVATVWGLSFAHAPVPICCSAPADADPLACGERKQNAFF